MNRPRSAIFITVCWLGNSLGSQPGTFMVSSLQLSDRLTAITANEMIPIFQAFKGIAYGPDYSADAEPNAPRPGSCRILSAFHPENTTALKVLSVIVRERPNASQFPQRCIHGVPVNITLSNIVFSVHSSSVLICLLKFETFTSNIDTCG